MVGFDWPIASGEWSHVRSAPNKSNGITWHNMKPRSATTKFVRSWIMVPNLRRCDPIIHVAIRFGSNSIGKLARTIVVKCKPPPVRCLELRFYDGKMTLATEEFYAIWSIDTSFWKTDTSFATVILRELWPNWITRSIKKVPHIKRFFQILFEKALSGQFRCVAANHAAIDTRVQNGSC